MGTFLYVYFKEHPDFLSVGMQNDGVFPLFIADHLPPGIAGLVIAGIYSASMSSLDSSMHSISTVFTVDYFKRFSSKYSEIKGLKIAKWVTIVVRYFRYRYCLFNGNLSGNISFLLFSRSGWTFWECF